MPFVQLEAGNSAEAEIYVVRVQKYLVFFSPKREIVLINRVISVPPHCPPNAFNLASF